MVPTFLELLEQENSRKMAGIIRDEVITRPVRLPELMDLFFCKDLRICQRASWPLTLIAEDEATLLYPYVERMLDNLAKPHHNAVIRNTFRTFQFMDFPEDIEGRVFDASFGYLLDIHQAIAIRVFAMTVCGNMAAKYPELAIELVPAIEERLPHGSAGFKARGKSILKRLR